MLKYRSPLLLLIKIIILFSLVKFFFFAYNYSIYNGFEITNVKQAAAIIGWSIYYDAVIGCTLLLPVLIASVFSTRTIVLNILFTTAMVFVFLLNAFDIIYFRFHRQRADSDLFFVYRNPFNFNNPGSWLLFILLIAFIVIISTFSWTAFNKIALRKPNTKLYRVHLFILLLVAIILFVPLYNKLLPSTPLRNVTANQLSLTQNSLHTFLYSLWRGHQAKLPPADYMKNEEAEKLFTIHKQNKIVSDTPRNIMLFIMESVPYEFFDTTSPLKPVLPFLDSLRKHSLFFDSAFSYSYNSNKGISAILAGLPTIIDVPVYHSGFVNLHKTTIGKSLSAKNYQSWFFIGDEYDEFGFAKCCNWTGIDHYQSKENIEGYKKMGYHSFGLHDEYVMNHMLTKIKGSNKPFFGTMYNITTHSPWDLPANFKKKLSSLNVSQSSKAMMYYDNCLKNFFSTISSEAWYKNTVFIFCSDHWGFPTNKYQNSNPVSTFRIPIFIFDPSVDKGKEMNNLVSQLDVMNTVLAYAGIEEPIISYGNSLVDTLTDSNRVVYTRTDDAIYQAINKQYVLGYNAESSQVLYFYEYRKDSAYKNNLVTSKVSAMDSLEIKMKVFLQTASLHYQNKLK